MTHASLFTGIGGMDLAAEWAGFETVLQVEQNQYCLKVLERHWPDVPRITDIKEVHADDRWTRPTVISGGFPCQLFSAAGKRGGQDDDRYLWPQMLRVIRELSPTYCVAENVSGLLSLNDGAEFELVLSDLERAGYETLPFHYPAASVGDPHRRDRVFIVGYSDANRESGRAEHAKVAERASDVGHAERIGWNRGWPEAGDRAAGQSRQVKPAGSGADVANAESERRREGRAESEGQFGPLCFAGSGTPSTVGHGSNTGRERLERRQPESAAHRSEVRRDPKWWAAQCGVGRATDGVSPWLDRDWEQGVPRVATGVKSRVDRLRALGNAVVPQQAYPIFATIAALEAERDV